jgi:hypothetical protein
MSGSSLLVHRRFGAICSLWRRPQLQLFPSPSKIPSISKQIKDVQTKNSTPSLRGHISEFEWGCAPVTLAFETLLLTPRFSGVIQSGECSITALAVYHPRKPFKTFKNAAAPKDVAGTVLGRAA